MPMLLYTEDWYYLECEVSSSFGYLIIEKSYLILILITPISPDEVLLK